MNEKNRQSELSRKKQRGFTLVEMSAMMVVLGILSMGITAFMNPTMNLMAQKNFLNGPVIEGRLAMARMVREINQIKDDTSISAATGTQLTFTDVNNQSVSYTLSSGSLLRNNIVMAKNVTSLQFIYYAADNTVLSTPTLSPSTNIKRIQGNVTVTVGGNSSTIRGHMFPRNI